MTSNKSLCESNQKSVLEVVLTLMSHHSMNIHSTPYELTIKGIGNEGCLTSMNHQAILKMKINFDLKNENDIENRNGDGNENEK